MNFDERLYLEAKKTYYQGNPIMSDYEFDTLEEKLREQGSNVIHIVGFEAETSEDVKHLTPMLSLQKIQVNDLSDKSIPRNKFVTWFTKTKQISERLIAEPKFDGSSCNLIYKNGKLVSAATRGNGITGTNITDKISLIVPNHISDLDLVEIRGEVIIKTKTFQEKYAKDFKNPRNFVAGILGRDDISEYITDFEFIAFEYKTLQENEPIHIEDQYELLENLGYFANIAIICWARQGSKSYLVRLELDRA
jgi:DNA ligase (NAD+)